MNFIGICILGIVVSMAAVLFKSGKNEYGIYLIAVAALFVFLLVLSGMKTLIAAIQEMKLFLKIGDAYINSLIKMIGISYLTQFSSDICKDCGHTSLANQIQIFGKVSVLAVSMPVVLSLMQTVESLL